MDRIKRRNGWCKIIAGDFNTPFSEGFELSFKAGKLKRIPMKVE